MCIALWFLPCFYFVEATGAEVFFMTKEQGSYHSAVCGQARDGWTLAEFETEEKYQALLAFTGKIRNATMW